MEPTSPFRAFLPTRFQSSARLRALATTNSLIVSLFTRAYMGALLIHYTKRWAEPEVALVFLAIFLLSLIRFDELVTFFLCNAAVIVVEISAFPRLANHTNLALFVAIFVWMNVAISLIRRRALGEAALVNGLRGMVVIIYFYVGFHKINSGFLNVATSCTSWYHDKVERVVFNGADIIPDFVRNYSPTVLIAMDLLIFAFLIFPRTWLIGLLLAVPIHMYVSFSGFTDFSSLMHAAMLLFLPAHFWAILFENPGLKRLFMRSMGVYFVGVLIYVIYSGLAQFSWQLAPNAQSTHLGILFNILILEVTVTILIVLLLARKPMVERATVGWAGWRASHSFFPLAIFIWGAFPYIFGSQTSLTMFSNLVTEEQRQNHLLINTNYTKLIDFEQDLVEVRYIDSQTRPPSRYDIQGYLIPRSEFRFIANMSTLDTDRRISMDIRDNGKEIRIDDLARSEYAERPLSSYFLTFRQIDAFGSAKCRW